MPGTAEFGEVFFVLGDLLVAKYDVDNDLYETPIALTHGQQLMIEPQHDTDQLRSYGTIAELLSIATSANITLSGGALDRDAFYSISDFSGYSSGLTPNRVVTIDAHAGLDASMPYFGAIGLGVTNGGGRIAVGLQKCKLNSQPQFSLNGQTNEFVIQEIEGVAAPVTRSSIQMLSRAKIYETASDWTAPTDGTEFKAFFTSPTVS